MPLSDLCIRCGQINPNTNKEVAHQLTSEGREANQTEEDRHNATPSWLSGFEVKVHPMETCNKITQTQRLARV